MEMTYCALQNILLQKDGSSQEWYVELGEFSFHDQSETGPFSIQCLKATSETRMHDRSEMG